MAVLFAVSLAACERPSPAPAPVPAVESIALEPTLVSQGQRFTATVIAERIVEVSFQVSGRVQSLLQISEIDEQGRSRLRPVQEGDTLPRGAVLAELDRRDYLRQLEQAQAALAQAQAAVQSAQLDFQIAQREANRKKELLGQNVATAKEYEDALSLLEIRRAALAAAQAAAQAAEVAVRVAEDRLADCQLQVPFDQATVVHKAIEVGQHVSAYQPVFVLADLTQVRARLGVPDIMLSDTEHSQSGLSSPRLYLGQELSLTSPAYPDRVFRGRVIKIAPTADPTTGSFAVELILPNPPAGPSGQRLLKPGMTLTLVLGQERSAVLVPLRAIVPGSHEGEFAVYLLQPLSGRSEGLSLVRRQPVQLGAVLGQYVEILGEGKDWQPGQRIVLEGVGHVFDGQVVRDLALAQAKTDPTTGPPTSPDDSRTVASAEAQP